MQNLPLNHGQASRFSLTGALWLAVVFITGSGAAAVGSPEVETPAAQRLREAFVWTQAAPPREQTYAVFRKTWTLNSMPAKAVLRIFGDNRYVLWINGGYVERGPCRFDPQRPEYDVLEVTKHLRPGRNALVVLAHYYAVGSFSAWNDQCARMMEHRPGLAAELELVGLDGSTIRHVTDASWRCTTQTRHLPSPGTYTSVPDLVDARRDTGDWTAVDFDDSGWPVAVPLAASAWAPMQPRSIPLLRESGVENLRIVEAVKAAAKSGWVAEQLPLELAAGARVVIDCGREVQAYTVLDFDAREGSRLELDQAARFFDTHGFSKATFGGAPNRYTAREGRQTYMTTDTFGCKYIQLAVTEGRITLRGLRVVDRLYPFDRLGRFASSDDLLDRIWQIGVRTVEVCSEDAHVDCADRERAQWLADGCLMGYPVARVSLAGPGAGGQPRYADSRLLRNLLRHVALSQLPDGRLQPMRPSEYAAPNRHGVIDDYSCLWIQAVADLYRREGDLELVRELWPRVARAVDYFLGRITDRGLVQGVEFVYFNNPLVYAACEGATLNAYFYRALRDAGELAQAVGDRAKAASFELAAERLYTAYQQQLWNESAGSYHSALMRPKVPISPDQPPSFSLPYQGPAGLGERTPPTGHAALMALHFDLAPPNKQARVFEFMRAQFPGEKAFPYTFSFYLEALYRRDQAELDREALQTMREHWRAMTQRETGTVSENWNDGSFVHESGAHPAYFLSSYVLGVRTDGPRTSRRLIIDPRLGDLARAEGVTLTEFGPVAVHWQRGGEQSLSFEIGNSTPVTALASLRVGSGKYSLVVAGHPWLRQGVPVAPEVSLKDGRIAFPLPPGKHLGRISLD